MIMYGSLQNILNNSYFWLLLFLLVITTRIPDIRLHAVEDNWNPLHWAQRKKTAPQVTYHHCIVGKMLIMMPMMIRIVVMLPVVVVMIIIMMMMICDCLCR